MEIPTSPSSHHLTLSLSHILMLTLISLGSLFGCKPKVINESSETLGPFKISWQVTEERSGAWFNNGGNPNAKQYTSWFSIQCNGKPIKVDVADKKESYFWQALFLKDAPKPAILAGVHSMYLITEENGEAKIQPLHEQDQDFATYQFLDSENGQPGEKKAVYLGDDSGSSRILSGGRYLMVNSKVVLDIQTLTIYPFDLITYEVLQKLEGYHAGNSFVAQLSPQKTQMVLIGNRDNPQNSLLYQYGLVVIDFKKNSAYAVPFDRTETRFFSIWDASPQWMNTYFEWTTDTNGEDLIQLRKWDQLPYWQGRRAYSEDNGELVQYKLMPIDTTMLPAFLDFIRNEVKITQETREDIPSYQGSTNNEPSFNLVNVKMETADGTIYIYMNPGEQSIDLSAKSVNQLKMLGDKFDSEMAKGKYQEFFGRYE